MSSGFRTPYRGDRRIAACAGAALAGMRAFRGIVLVASVLALSGCLHLEQTLRINPDGSARFIYQYSVSEDDLPGLAAGQSTIELWQGAEAESDSRYLNWFFNERAVRRHFTEKGMRVVGFSRFSAGGRHHVQFEVEADSLRRALAGEKHGRFIHSRDVSDNVIVRLDLPAAAVAPAADGAGADTWRALTAGFRALFAIETPGDIVATSGRLEGARRAVWVIDADTDPRFVGEPPLIKVSYRPVDGTVAE